MEHRFEVIIVGAGAAGIACAERMNRAGVDFLLLEGRPRIGGRILSLPESQTPPLELGAEFIHGVPAYTLEWLRKLGLNFYDVQDIHHLLNGKNLEKHPFFWKELGAFMKPLDHKGKSDRSIEEYLDKHKKLNPRILPFFKTFVEGFHGADLAVLGEKGLASTEEADDDQLNGAKMFRSVGSYRQLLEGILKTFSNEANTQLETVVKEVSWKEGEITLRCQSGRMEKSQIFQYRKLVLTVPVGVLNSNSIVWTPRPRELDQLLDGVRMGHAQRIIFRFKERFWETLSTDPISFLHAGPEYDFPTWWTFQPMRTPYLVAWQGGPKAEGMAGLPIEERVEKALMTLSKLTKHSKSFLEARLEQHFSHDWTSDPFTRGAYSYIAVGGLKKWQRARRIQDTLFFTGEAFAEGASRGTVEGAFISGAKTATQIINSLSTSRSSRL